MKSLLKTLVVVSACAVLTSGCAPRWALVRPAATFTVHSDEGKPVQGARVVVVTASAPHGVYHGETSVETDANGNAQVEASRRWEWITPLLIHGISAYFIIWCAESSGYGPLSRKVWVSEFDGSVIDIRLTKNSNASTCKDELSKNYLLLRH
jgi:hypothetical protein